MDREQKIDKIYDAIVGNEFNDGIIKKIDTLQTRVEKLETFKNKFVYVASGAGIVGGVALDKVWSVLKHVFIVGGLFLLVGCRTVQRTLEVQQNDSLHIEHKKATITELATLRINDSITLEGNVILHKDGTITSSIAKVNRRLESETKSDRKEEAKQETKVKKLEKQESKKTVSPLYFWIAISVGVFFVILAIKSRIKI